MASLNAAKKETQIILKWIGVSLLIIFLFFMGIRLLAFMKAIFTPPPPPSASFGKLPKISFPKQVKENLSFTLDTISGFLPNFSDRTNVFKITSEPPTLLGLTKAREKVSGIGFTSNGTQIAEDIYQWTDQNSPLQRTITMNIFSSDFSLSSSYLVAPSLEAFSKQDEADRPIDVAKSFLSSMSLFPQDIDENRTKTTPYSILGSALKPATKISDTKIVEVSFFQKDVNNLPIYYDKGISSTINFFVGKDSDGLKVVDGRFFHKNISQTSSTYAIKSTSQAYSELQKGNAYIAYKPDNMVEFTINKVSLGYYIGEDQQDFLMPIIAFEGNDNFTAYVSAVRDEWINN